MPAVAGCEQNKHFESKTQFLAAGQFTTPDHLFPAPPPALTGGQPARRCTSCNERTPLEASAPVGDCVAGERAGCRRTGKTTRLLMARQTSPPPAGQAFAMKTSVASLVRAWLGSGGPCGRDPKVVVCELPRFSQTTTLLCRPPKSHGPKLWSRIFGQAVGVCPSLGAASTQPSGQGPK